MESSTNTSLETRQSTNDEIEYRQKILCDVIDEAKNRGDVINENYLLYKMKLRGFENYTRSKLYNDRLTLDSQNNYIRHFLPKYSKYQEDINTALDDIDQKAQELFNEKVTVTKITVRDTPDGPMTTKSVETGSHKIKAEMLKIRTKVAELKQKHSEGQNIDIAAVIIQEELVNQKNEIEKLKTEGIIKVVKSSEEKD